MEIRSHRVILKNSSWFIFLITILVGLAAFMFAMFKPSVYEAVVSFNVEFVNRPATTDYQFGAYYDLKAAEAYTQHLMSWFMTPAIVQDVYQKAGVGYRLDSLARFTHQFRTKQYSSQNFAVIFKGGQREAVEKLAVSVSEIVSKRAPRAVQLQDQPVFDVEALEPMVVESRLNVWLAAGVGAAAGFLLSLILVYWREYWKE